MPLVNYDFFFILQKENAVHYNEAHMKFTPYCQSGAETWTFFWRKKEICQGFLKYNNPYEF